MKLLRQHHTKLIIYRHPIKIENFIEKDYARIFSNPRPFLVTVDVIRNTVFVIVTPFPFVDERHLPKPKNKIRKFFFFIKKKEI